MCSHKNIKYISRAPLSNVSHSSLLAAFVLLQLSGIVYDFCLPWCLSLRLAVAYKHSARSITGAIENCAPQRSATECSHEWNFNEPQMRCVHTAMRWHFSPAAGSLANKSTMTTPHTSTESLAANKFLQPFQFIAAAMISISSYSSRALLERLCAMIIVNREDGSGFNQWHGVRMEFVW